jgi:hypothetical protein
MKPLTFGMMLICLLSFPLRAEIVEVYRWEPYPGKNMALIEAMQEAADIHTNLGATVQINRLDIGTSQQIDYVMRFDDLAAWGSAKTKLASSQDWAEFGVRASSDPSGKLVESLLGTNLDQTDFADKTVFSVFIWDPAPGRSLELQAGFAAAKMIHEANGAKVDSYLESFGGSDKLHYVMSFDSWDHMAEVQAKFTSDPAWIEFQAANASATDPVAELIMSFAGSTLMNFD